jgi:hypothetical protein
LGLILNWGLGVFVSLPFYLFTFGEGVSKGPFYLRSMLIENKWDIT